MTIGTGFSGEAEMLEANIESDMNESPSESAQDSNLLNNEE